MPFLKFYQQNFTGPVQSYGPPDPHFPQSVTWGFGASHPGLSASAQQVADGIQIEVTRDVQTDTVSYGIFVTPVLLANKERVRLTATFKSPTGPHAPFDTTKKNARSLVDSIWGVVAMFRSGGLPDLGAEKRITATLQHNLAKQWSDTPARLNSSGNAQSTAWLSVPQYAEIYQQDHEFTLALEVDLAGLGGGGTGPTKPLVSCSLSVGGAVVSELVQFEHHEALPPGTITAAGVGIAVVATDSSKAKVSVTVTRMDLSSWTPWPVWLWLVVVRVVRRFPRWFVDIWKPRP